MSFDRLVLWSIILSMASVTTMITGLTLLYHGFPSLEPMTVYYEFSQPNLPAGPPMKQPHSQHLQTPSAPSYAAPVSPAPIPTAPAPSQGTSASSPATLPVFESMGGGGKSGPKLRQGAKPGYPNLAWERGIEGRVRVKLTVNEQGKITNVEVVQGSDSWGFITSVKTVLKAWEFEPYTPGGHATGFVLMKTFEFVLE